MNDAALLDPAEGEDVITLADYVDGDGRARASGGTEVAVAGLALSVLWLFFVGSLLGLVLGLVARRRLTAERDAAQPSGAPDPPSWAASVAGAAVVLGALGVAVGAVLALLVVAGVLDVTAVCHPAVTGEACHLVVRSG